MKKYDASYTSFETVCNSQKYTLKNFILISDNVYLLCS